MTSRHWATPTASTGCRPPRRARRRTPTGSGGANASPSFPTRRDCPWFRTPNRPIHGTPPAAGTGWTRDTRDALFAAARRRGVTPAMALAASFSDALAGWSAEPRFLLNVPMFGREQLHSDVDSLVGDFTSSLLLDVDLTAARTATARARAVQETFHAAAAHASYSGLSVLRDLARHRGTQVLAPVVFTSALGLGELFAADVTDHVRQAGLDQLPRPAGTARRAGHRVRRRRPGQLGRPRGRLPAGASSTRCSTATSTNCAGSRPTTHRGTPGQHPLITAAQRGVRDALNAKTAHPSGNSLHAGSSPRPPHGPTRSP